MAIHENILTHFNAFPVEIFIQQNLSNPVYVPEHYHECFEILYVLCGSAKQMINCTIYPIKKGDVILLKGGDIHRTYDFELADTQIFVLKFMPYMIDKSYSIISESKYLAAFLNSTHYHPIITLEQTSREYLHQLLSSLLTEYRSRNKGYDLYVKGYILELMGFLVRQNVISTPNEVSDSTQLAHFNHVIRYIEENYSQDISLKNVSDLLNMNYSYVSRYFKKITSRTFKQFLDYVRVCEASTQLVTTDKNITTIAFDCGFNSLQAFTRTYTRILGFPPSELKSKKVLKQSKK